MTFRPDGCNDLLVGIVAVAVTAPLFDHMFTYRLALTCKLLCPPLGGAWLSLIWAGAILCFFLFRGLALI